MSTLKVDTIQGKTTASNVIMPTGHVLQVKRALRNSTSHETFSSTSFATSTLSVSLTPKASGNKVIVQCTIGLGNYGGGSSEANTALYIDGSNVSSTNGGSSYFWCGYWDSSNTTHGCTGYYEYTTVDTSAHTFALYCKVYSEGNFYLHKGASHSLVCTEIQS